MNEHVVQAMSGAPDYEQKELRSSKEHISAVLRMARAELLLLCFYPMDELYTKHGKKYRGNLKKFLMIQTLVFVYWLRGHLNAQAFKLVDVHGGKHGGGVRLAAFQLWKLL